MGVHYVFFCVCMCVCLVKENEGMRFCTRFMRVLLFFCYFNVIVTLVGIPHIYLGFKHFHNYNPNPKNQMEKNGVGLGGT